MQVPLVLDFQKVLRRGPKRLAPLAKRSTCSKSTLVHAFNRLTNRLTLKMAADVSVACSSFFRLWYLCFFSLVFLQPQSSHNCSNLPLVPRFSIRNEVKSCEGTSSLQRPLVRGTQRPFSGK